MIRRESAGRAAERGISADKAAKYEGGGRQIDSEPGTTSKLLGRFEVALAAGNTLSLTVSPRPVDADAIDVEVESTG